MLRPSSADLAALAVFASLNWTSACAQITIDQIQNIQGLNYDRDKDETMIKLSLQKCTGHKVESNTSTTPWDQSQA